MAYLDKFQIKPWIEKHIPRVYHRRAVQILDGTALTFKEIEQVFNLGKQIRDEESVEEIRDLQATVNGLTDALQAKNEITVNIITWPSILILLLILLVEIYRTLY